ncbi:hypothetical protein MY11210_004146 [Beauveria gryllotalpidicola]
MVFISSGKALVLSALVAISFASEPRRLRLNETIKSNPHGNPLTEEFNRYVKSLMDEWKVPGMSVAVIDDDQVNDFKGYGFAVLPDTPVKPETLFLGGSTTKAHLAATIAQMISSGDYNDVFPLGWNTPMSYNIRDDFVLEDEWATAHITLEDAVSHRTGMARHMIGWVGTGEPNDTSKEWKTNKATVRNLRNLPMTAEPRVVFQYCDLMFIALAHIVETVTGSWVGDVLNKALWQPLGMRSTFLSYGDARKSGQQIATGYFWDDDAQQYVGKETDPVQSSSAAGALISNVIDYSKWIMCLMNATAPLSAEAHTQIRIPRMLVGPTEATGWQITSYGLAWERTTFYGKVLFKHDGGTQNFGANVVWMPDTKFAVIMFANAVDGGNLIEEVITQRLIEERLGLPVQDRRGYLDDTKRNWAQATLDFDNATNILYPGRATDASSHAVDINLFAGNYSHPGYGTYAFSVENSSVVASETLDKQPQEQLVALREDLITPTRFVLRHAAGDFWVAYQIPIGGAALGRDYYRARFYMGVDGKPTTLEITFAEEADRISELVIQFERVDK